MIQIITDSMSDIHQEEAQNYALTVLAQHVILGPNSYLDGIDLSREAFYQWMSTANELPKTSQVSPDAYAEAFALATGRGDEVLCICGSSKLSGCYQSALIARDMQAVDAPIFVIDSLQASLSQQVLIWEAVRLRDAGESAPAIAEKISALVSRVQLVGYVPDLKHLVMGGRLSAAKAHIGTTLNLRPMLRLHDGMLEQAGVTRGEKHCFEWIKKQYDAAPRDENYPIYLASSNAPEKLAIFHRYLEREGLAGTPSTTISMGPVIGSHAGQGVLALAWVKKDS